MDPVRDMAARLLKGALARRELLFIWSCLLALAWIYLQKALLYLPASIAPDAALIYLPYAKRLLEEGSAFLWTPESVYVPPFSFMWPALFGGDAGAVKTANLFAGVAMIFLCYGIGKRAHSRDAGLVAALLFVISPLLISWIPTPLSEPPFYLFTLIWLWGMGEVVAGNKWAIPIAAIGLALSILTRSIWLYPSVLLLFILIVMSFRRPASRLLLRRLALILVLGLLLPASVIMKNLVLFGMPAIDTGTGGALYYGANILTDGFEPPLLGLTYEDGGDSRSFAGNREHALVAMQFFSERSWPELAVWFLQKATWVTLFTRLEAPMSWTIWGVPMNCSLWRIIELAFAAAALRWAIRHRQPLALILAGGVVVQILQTSLVLYNIRYSVDNVELLLVPLAAIGMAVTANGLWSDVVGAYRARLSGQPGAATERGWSYLLLGVAVYLALYGVLKLRPMPRINVPPQVPVWTLFEYRGEMRHAAMPHEPAGLFVPASIELQVPALTMPAGGSTNAIWQFNIAIDHAPGRRCTKARARFVGTGPTALPGNGGMAYFDVTDDGTSRNYNIGTAYMNAGLFPAQAGTLTLTFNCAAENDIRLKKAAVIVPRTIERYFGRGAHGH